MKAVFILFNLFTASFLIFCFFIAYATAGGKNPNEAETRLTFYLFWRMNGEHLVRGKK